VEEATSKVPPETIKSPLMVKVPEVRALN